MQSDPAAKATSIFDFFEDDHRQLDALLEGVSFDSPREAAGRFREFDRRLERHILWEEEILFPAVSRAAPHLEMGPLRVMKMEHEQIRASKAGALKALEDGDVSRARDNIQAMARVLGEHNLKEEHVLYPACDELLSREAAADILLKIGAPRG